MQNRDVSVFLQCFPADELIDRRILNIGRDGKYILQGSSVEPLLELMNEQGVSRLESRGHRWFLDVSGEFNNKKSKKRNIAGLTSLGPVFTGMNKLINPHFDKRDTGLKAALGEVKTHNFPLERDLRSAPRPNILRMIGNVIRTLTKMPNRNDAKDTIETGNNIESPHTVENITINIEKVIHGSNVEEGVLQHKVNQAPSNESLESFGFCPKCREELKLPKAPRACPNCGEKLSVP